MLHITKGVVIEVSVMFIKENNLIVGKRGTTDSGQLDHEFNTPVYNNIPG